MVRALAAMPSSDSGHAWDRRSHILQGNLNTRARSTADAWPNGPNMARIFVTPADGGAICRTCATRNLAARGEAYGADAQRTLSPSYTPCNTDN